MAQGSREEDRSTGGLAGSSQVVIAGPNTEESEQIQKRQILSQESISLSQDIRGDCDNRVDQQGPYRHHLFHVNNLCVFHHGFIFFLLARYSTSSVINLQSIFTGQILNFVLLTFNSVSFPAKSMDVDACLS